MLFTLMLWAVPVIVGLAMLYAYSQSSDVFHPLMFIGPMMIFMYAWMPMKLDSVGGLDGFFQRSQLEFVQGINVAGVICFIFGCLSIGCRLPASRPVEPHVSPRTLVVSGVVVGVIGLAAWLVTIVNVGGFTEAFSKSYSGGWDDNGYVRDASLLMFPATLMILYAQFQDGFKFLHVCLIALFISPLAVQAAFTSRRGPTFMIVVLLTMGWFLNRRTRPSLALTVAAGLMLGFLMLFLVTNRGNIYLGSDQEMTVDVTSIVETPDTGNEYIYGTGGILSSDQRNSFYWGRRYLAQVLIRPIPHTVWPTKYEDFGLPEINHNAGTGEGLTETLGWQGAEGSAPGLIADLWMEFSWLNMPALFLLGRLYGRVWWRANVDGGPWIPQYAIMSALSIYFVMQTMEAVIFRLLILALPVRLTWHFAQQNPIDVPAYEESAPFVA